MTVLADFTTRRIAVLYRRDHLRPVLDVIEAHQHAVVNYDTNPLAAGPARIDVDNRYLVADVIAEHADAFKVALEAALADDHRYSEAEIAAFAKRNPRLFSTFMLEDGEE